MKQGYFLRNTALCALAGTAAISAAVLVAPAAFASNFPFEAPPDGRPGECFARVMVPAQYDTVTEQIVVDEGGARIQVTPPQFAAQTQQYLVREAGVRYEVRQPVYRTVTEQVMVRPGHQVLQVVPGEYRNVTEQVQISEPRLAWKPGTSLASRAGVRVTQTHQGEVYCLVEEPGETQSVSRRVQVRPEQVRAVNVPAMYQTVTREVMVDPGGVREVPVPPRYGNLTIQQLVRPAGQTSQPIPQRMGQVSRRVQVSAESFRWVKVLCETNATPAAISEVQTLLHDQGYFQGQVTGRVDRGTETAIAQYQQRMNIPHGGFLSLQTIDSLRGGYAPAQQAPVQYAPAPQPHAQYAPAPQTSVQYPPAVSSAGNGYASSASYGWSQSAPVQYSYQGTGQGAGWSAAHGHDTSWIQSGAGYGQTYSEGQIISRIPAGEITTQIEPQALAAGSAGGAQHWHNGRYLQWSGK
jgi:peptidoglycan hydrolase-like protein with peptidoglycan-binding domain